MCEGNGEYILFVPYVSKGNYAGYSGTMDYVRKYYSENEFNINGFLCTKLNYSEVPIGKFYLGYTNGYYCYCDYGTRNDVAMCFYESASSLENSPYIQTSMWCGEEYIKTINGIYCFYDKYKGGYYSCIRLRYENGESSMNSDGSGFIGGIYMGYFTDKNVQSEDINWSIGGGGILHYEQIDSIYDRNYKKYFYYMKFVNEDYV